MHRSPILFLAIALSFWALGCAETGAPEGEGEAADTVAATDAADEEEGARSEVTPMPPTVSTDTLSAALRDTTGGEVGTVTLVGTPNGLLVEADFDGLPPGEHAFHLHETGACEPDFGAAGGHLNPEGSAHGILSPDGPHAGDMPNVHIPDAGALTVEVFAPGAAIEDLRDDDGAAVVIHAGADDYRTDPAGAAGDRIACGAIE